MPYLSCLIFQGIAGYFRALLANVKSTVVGTGTTLSLSPLFLGRSFEMERNTTLLIVLSILLEAVPMARATVPTTSGDFKILKL